MGVGTNVLDGNYRTQIAGDGVVYDSTCAITDGSTAATATSTAAFTAGDKIYGPGTMPVGEEMPKFFKVYTQHIEILKKNFFFLKNFIINYPLS